MNKTCERCKDKNCAYCDSDKNLCEKCKNSSNLNNFLDIDYTCKSSCSFGLLFLYSKIILLIKGYGKNIFKQSCSKCLNGCLTCYYSYLKCEKCKTNYLLDKN